LRAAAAFVRFRAPTAFSSTGTLAGIFANTIRLRRFDVLDGRAPAPYARLLGHPLLGFTLRSFFLSLDPGFAVASRTRAVQWANLSIHPQPLPAYRFRICNPTNKFAARHIRFGFWALLPLRVRQPPAGVTPRTTRCFLGFRLSKDLSLPATARLHGRSTLGLAPPTHGPRRCPSAVYPAGRSAFPRLSPRCLSSRGDRDAVLSEVSALLVSA